MMSHVQDGRAHMHYVIQGFFKLNWSLLELSKWYATATILSAIELMLFLWCLRLYVGFQWIFSLKFEHLDFKLFRFFFPYCQIVAVAETCCWYYIDAQTIKLCLLTCLLSDCWLCNKTPSNLGGKKKTFTLIWIIKQRNLDLSHTKPASLFAYKGGKNPPQHRQNYLTTPPTPPY